MNKTFDELTVNGYTFNVYGDINPDANYIVAVNVGSGLSSDKSTILIVNPEPITLIASIDSYNISINDLNTVLELLIKYHIPKSTLYINRSAEGSGVINTLFDRNGDVRKRLYFQVVDGRKIFGIYLRASLIPSLRNAVTEICYHEKNNLFANQDNMTMMIVVYAIFWCKHRKSLPDDDDKNSVTDSATKNQSFIETANELKSLGVVNWDFMLKTIHPCLIGIDPHNPSLDIETRELIKQECELNPWYFFREVLRIPETDGSTVPFILHRGNLAMIYLYLNGIDTLVYLPVSNYKTISAISTILYTFLFKRKNDILLGSTSNTRSDNLYSKLLDLIFKLPNYMIPNMTKSGSFIAGKKINTDTLSSISTLQAMVTEQKAISVARDTVEPIQYIDEAEFVSHIKEFFTYSAQPYSTAKMVAMEEGRHYGRILTSVFGDLETESAKFVNTIFTESAIFTEEMYDFDKETLLNYISTISKNGFVSVIYHYTQLRRNIEWFEEMTRVVNKNEKSIKREILLQRHSSNKEDELLNDMLIQFDKLSKSMAKFLECRCK